jgi:penicillin-binding protein 1C
VLDAEGGILRAFTTSDGMWRLPVEAGQVDENYVDALIAYEDQRFYSHPGIDPLAIVRAAGQWARHWRIVSGASTLTMQTVRLLEPRSRTLGAKVIEALRALQLERRYRKDEILSIYLTLAPFGGNLEGVRAASLAYFGKEPAELSVSQAALLVALPQSPERLRPDRNPGAATVARARVLALLADRGALTASDAAEANEDPLPSARAALPFRAPRLARALRRTADDNGMVRTYIDPTIQAQVERISDEVAAGLEGEASLAIIVVENATRRVVAYSGGSDFWGPGGQVDLARAARSPGSALKPFIYGMAFDDLALHPETLITDQASIFGTYAPQNFDREFLGEVTVRTALQQSLNVPAVMVLDGVGPMRFASRLRQVGADLQFGSLGGQPSLPLALGGVGISLTDLTMLYTALADGGSARPLIFSDQDDPAAPRHLMGEAAAWYVTDILEGAPLPEGRGQGRGHVQQGAIAYKTGTSYGYRDAWAVGYAGHYTVGIWVGRPDGSPRPGSYGRNTAAPVLFQVFDQLPISAIPQAAPEDVIRVARRNDLPLVMQRYRAPQLWANASGREVAPPPRIAFPPAGANINLMGDQGTELSFRALGGTPPLRWMVDGALVPAADIYQPTLWRTADPGFADITVIDAEGRVDRARIRLIN